jgi:hypothetical protein
LIDRGAKDRFRQDVIMNLLETITITAHSIGLKAQKVPREQEL